MLASVYRMMIAVLAVAATDDTLAQTLATGTDSLEEILVTAERRETKLQETPISITAVTGEGLAARGVTNLTEIAQLAPNLVASSGTVSSNDGNYFIRGIGQTDAFSNVEPGVGVYLDGVYLGRTAGAALDLVDLERVEVIRGPQGTLFGRNTIGGAINLTTSKPAAQLDGRALLRAGERDRIDTGLTIDVPLIPATLKSRFSFISRHRNGDAHVVGPGGGRSGDDREVAGRAAVSFTPLDKLSIDATLDGTRRTGTAQCSYSVGFNPVSPGIPPAAVAQANPPRSECYTSIVYNHAEVKTWGGALAATLNTDAVTLKSITALRGLSQDAPVDNDGSNFNLYDLLIRKHQTQLSEELQGFGKALAGRLDWLLGAYYFRERIHEQQQLTFAVAGPDYFRLRDFSPETKSVAIFGQATFALSDSLSATAGVRWTRDNKPFRTLDQDLRGGTIKTLVDAATEATWTATTPKAGLQYKFAPNGLLYASYSEGFRSGGFNARVRTAGQLVPFDPEKAKVYELGVKLDGLDQRLRINGDAFYTDYRRIQILALEGGFFSNRNAGDARLYGFELEAAAKPIPTLTIDLGTGYTDSGYTRLLPGTGLTTQSPLPFVPTWTATAGVQLESEAGQLGRLRSRVDYAYKSTQNIFSPKSLEPGYGIVNARIALQTRHGIEVALYGHNLLNRRYANYRSVDLSGAPGSLGISNEFLGLPRELGVEAIVPF